MKVDLERLRRGVTNARNGVRYGPGEPMAALTIDELEALLAVVDAARNGVLAWSEGAYADIDVGSLEAALEPFGPERPDRAWEEVDRWNAERDLAVKAAVDAAKVRVEPGQQPTLRQGDAAQVREWDAQARAARKDPRDRARDRLADAGVVVQRQFRSDQERIAELEAERDEWRGRHKAVTNGLSNHVARADEAEERIAELERELADVREQLWDSWWSYHDEHCHDPWPHDGSCSYPPPAAARERRP